MTSPGFQCPGAKATPTDEATLEAQKKRGLIANTNVRLNIPLISLQSRGQKAIGKRGELLADAAVKVWAGPQP